MARLILVIATALAAAAFAAAASAHGHPHIAGAPAGHELIPAFNGIERDARAQFRSAYGCVIDGPRKLGFLITARSQLAAARAIVRKNRATAFTRIAVIARRYGEPRMLAVMRAGLRDPGNEDPNYIIRSKPAQTPAAKRCLTVVVDLSDQAPLLVGERVLRFQKRFGDDRVKIHRVPPEQVPPPDRRLETR
jgi:hypothetical protein